jgi:tRNA(adenine34) deaminase
MHKDSDNYFMTIALEEAKLAFDKDEVPIGAVLIKDNEVIARSHNQRELKNSPISHAEIEVIEQASQVLGSWRLIDTTLYVTSEPCIMCIGAIIHSRIKRLVYGCSEPKMGAVKSIAKLLDINELHHKPEYKGAVMEEESKALLQEFFKKLRR